MQFSVEEIKLDRIQFKYTDAVTKNNLYANLKHFETKIKTFDLNEMSFEIPKAKINGLKLKLKQGLVQISNATKVAAIKNEPESILKLKLGEIDLAKIDFDYESEETKLSTHFYLKNYSKLIKLTSTINSQLSISEVTGVEGALAFDQLESDLKKEANAESNNWDVKIKKTEFKRVNFRYDNNVAVQKVSITTT
jgi:hypothetical protein